ncbi:MAG TPA: DUF4870 domain-containing protein [Spongiibacteraceae bacterium]|jgi:hypothetical protein
MTNDAEFLPAIGQSKEERTWATLSHLSIVAQIFLPILVFAPLVILMIKGNQMPFVKMQSKEVLNFQITLLLAGVAGCLLIVVGIGIVLLFALWLYSIVAGIIGAVKANEGVAYRYPINLRLIS